MGQTKPWILTGSVDYHPNQHLCIGQILSHARDPSSALFADTTQIPFPTGFVEPPRTTQDGVSFGSNSDEATAFGIWAKAGPIPVAAEVKAGGAQQESLEWRVRQMRTRITVFDDAHASTIVNHATVKEYARNRLRSSPLLFPTLYIVIGIRVAHGARITYATDLLQDGELKVAANNAAGQGTGVQLKHQKRVRQTVSIGRASDFVFAYQCREIHAWPYPRLSGTVRGTVQSANIADAVDDSDDDEDDGTGLGREWDVVIGSMSDFKVDTKSAMALVVRGQAGSETFVGEESAAA